MIIRSNSHKKEDQSKRDFEATIEPWYVVGWTARDYGIDAIVGLTSAMKGNDLRVESKFFLTQLKASEVVKKSNGHIAFSVPVKKIHQWVDFNLPVLFVLNDLVTKTFYYKWMDEALLAELDLQNKNWAQQKNITIYLPPENTLCNDRLIDFKNYIVNFKQKQARVVESGKFFEMKAITANLLHQFSEISNDFQFASIQQSIEIAHSALDQALYRVAITGMSRVGKSSLINALLKKEISPVGFFQTTGVPIQVIPDKEEYIEVLFKDRTKHRYPLSFDTITQYASQDPEYNEDNKKQVSLLTIGVKNKDLQKGISVFDIPGLDEPNDDIYEYTWSTVTKAHAIIYVIDISSAQHGGFIFGKEHKKLIYELGQSLDKIFLVFNKADAVDEEKLSLVKDRINADLRKWGLHDKIERRIYYTTTIKDKEGRSLDKMSLLEKDLWDFIVNENKYGIIRLAEVLHQIEGNLSDLKSLLNARLLELSKKEELIKAIQVIQNRIPFLRKEFHKKIEEFQKRLFHQLEVWKNERLLELQNWLKSFPVNNDLPGGKEVKSFLRLKLQEALEMGNHEFIYFIFEQKEFVDAWIEEHLRQIREMLSSNAQGKTVDFSELETLETPNLELASSVGMGIFAYIAAAAYNPAVALVAGLMGFVGNLIMSSESRRAKRIDRYMTESRKRYDSTFHKLKDAYSELVKEQTYIINIYMEKKLDLYFSDLQKQLKNLGEVMPASDVVKYNNAFDDLKNLYRNLIHCKIEIKSYLGK